MNILITNINLVTRINDIKPLFDYYGEVSSVRLVMDRDTQISKGYGFVIMPNESEGQNAITNLNGYELHGKNLNVSSI